MIRLAIPDIGCEEIAAAAAVLESGWLVQGEQVARFEVALSGLVGGRDVVAVSSGTAALHIALLALNIRAGDIVIVPTYSWLSTANAVELCGANPVFVDIDPESLNIAPSALATTLERLAHGPFTTDRVRAVVVVHSFGAIADMTALQAIAAQYRIPIIEDAACAIGSHLGNKPAGSWGDVACLSFHPRKVITTGEGGAVVVDDSQLARRLRALRNHGLDSSAPVTEFCTAGLNYRMSEVEAAVGIAQLAKLPRLLHERRQRAAIYREMLAGSRICLQRTEDESGFNYQSFIVLLPKGLPIGAVLRKMHSDGIEVNVGTWHIPLTGYFKAKYGYRIGDFPSTDAVFARALCLPLSTKLTRDEQAAVVRSLLAAVEDLSLQ
jgi:perosamine synthetase